MVFDPLEPLRRDAERIRRALPKPYVDVYTPDPRRRYNWELTIFFIPTEAELTLMLAGYGLKLHWLKGMREYIAAHPRRFGA